MRTLHHEAAVAALLPRGGGEVKDLLAGPCLEVGVGLEAGQLWRETMLHRVAGHADVQLERAFDAL